MSKKNPTQRGGSASPLKPLRDTGKDTALRRLPLHWQTTRIAGSICSAAGVEWNRSSRSIKVPPVAHDPDRLQVLLDRYGWNVIQAAKALRRNYRWHLKHPSPVIRWGDIPF